MFRRPLMHTLLAGLLAAAGAVHAALPEPIVQMLQAANIPQDAVGVVVLRGPRTLLWHGGERSMQPASTMKVLTTMAALEQLGPVFRGRTELRSSAELVKGVLQGDLYLRGGADSDLNEDALYHMLQTLRNQGIRKIKGDIVLDRQLFQPARLDAELPPFDEYPYAYYNVVPDALLVNSNLLKLDMEAGGNSLKLLLTPELDRVSVASELKLIDAPCANWEAGWKPPEVERHGGKLKVVLRGSFPKDCSKSTSINVLDRHDYLERLLRGSWSRLGGSLGGEVREATAEQATPAAARLLSAHQSRTLAEVLRDTNKHSDNTLAHTLFLSLGSLEADAALGSRALPPEPSGQTTAARADLAVRNWMRERGIDQQGLVLENGAGLSRVERIRPAQLAAVLQAAQRSLWAPEFAASLPIAALDGTMRQRLKDSPAALRARLKTGSLSGVAALAGFVPDAANQQCVVVAMINDAHVANGAGRAVLDALVDWVARSDATTLP